MSDFKYLLDGVPNDLVTLIKTKDSIRKYLARVEASGIRLVKHASGWSDYRDKNLKTDEAFHVEILGPDGEEICKPTGGLSFAKLDGEWCQVQTTPF
jgi:hypothetical protein